MHDCMVSSDSRYPFCCHKDKKAELTFTFREREHGGTL